MIKFEEISFDKDITKAEFSCDLNACKGACCTFYGDFGAPVLEDEVFMISDSLKEIRNYLEERSLETIKAHGFVEGAPGSYTTMCIDRKDCVFVVYDGDIAKCAIEKAYLAGKIKFRKPISCHIFPIRMSDFDGIKIYYERISECKPAVVKGKKEGIPMLTFLKEAIIRQFGEDFYQMLKAKAK